MDFASQKKGAWPSRPCGDWSTCSSSTHRTQEHTDTHRRDACAPLQKSKIKLLLVLEAGYEEFALEDDFLGEFAVEFDEKFVLEEEFAVPLGGVDLLRLGEDFGCDGSIETVHVDVGVVG